MNMPATESSVDVASWFVSRARKDEWFLENEKLMLLVFLSQVHYAVLNNMENLMPATFVVSKNGFEEPNLAKILSTGFQLQSMTYFSANVATFLEKMWRAYGAMSIRQLSEIIKNRTNYLKSFAEAQKSIVDLKTLVENFKSSANISNDNDFGSGIVQKKVLMSQRGPVVVSQWRPRKLGERVFEI